MGKAMNLYRAALDGWTEDQWIKGTYKEADAVCLVGRIRQITGKSDWAFLFDGYFRRALIDCGYDAHDPESMNDDPSTTFADVCQVLEKAAAYWDEDL